MSMPAPLPERFRVARPGGAGGNLGAFLRNPLTLFERAGRSGGPLVRVPIVPGTDIFLITDPALVEQVLVTRRHNFAKPQKLGNVTPALGMGLQTSDGYFHLRQRALVEPAMRPEAVVSYGRHIVEAAVRVSERWREGEVVDVHAECLHLTFSLVGEALFGMDVASEASHVEDALETLMERCQRYAQPLGSVLDRVPTAATKRQHEGAEALDAFLDGRIRAVRAGEAGEGSVLARILSEGGGVMSDAEARDEATILFLAGRETIGDVLAWTLFELARNPDADAALHAELDTVLGRRVPDAGDLGRLPYTDKVIREGLRLYPVGWAILRQAVTDDELGGLRVPAGAPVLVSPWVLHRDGRVFPEPDRFRPERWDGPEPVPPFAYVPFSAGPRSCMGEHFARLALPLLLAVVAQRWTARLAPGPEVQAVPTFAIRPKGGMPMTLERRVRAPVPT
jgi:cytochrome P450